MASKDDSKPAQKSLVEHAKGLAALPGEKLAELKAFGEGKLQESMDAFVRALPALKQAGFELREFEVELGLTPRIISHFASVPATAEDIAASAGATAEVTIDHNAIPVVNPPAITQRTRAVLQRALGEANVRSEPPGMVAEDFAYFQQAVPGVFFYYGINPPGVAAAQAAPNHSPRFFVHEPAMETALRAVLAVALDRVGGA